MRNGRTWLMGLLILAGGDQTRVLEPRGMLAEGLGVVEDLLRHHSIDSPPPLG